jgi:hypothetical protein
MNEMEIAIADYEISSVWRSGMAAFDVKKCVHIASVIKSRHKNLRKSVTFLST